LNKSGPLVSIIIPTYNRFIRFIQDFPSSHSSNIEIIVVDDHSDHRYSSTILNSLSSLGISFRYFYCDLNSGPGFCRNIGIKMALGKFLMFIDSDDYLTRASLTSILSVIEQFLSDIDIFLIDVCNEGCSDTLRSSHYTPLTPIGTLCLSDLVHNRFLSYRPVDKIVRRQFLVDNDIFFPSSRSYEDIAYSRMLFCCQPRCMLIPNAYYLVSNTPESVSRSIRRRDKDIASILQYENSWLAERSPFSASDRWLLDYSNLRLFFYEAFSFLNSNGCFRLQSGTYVCRVFSLLRPRSNLAMLFLFIILHQLTNNPIVYTRFHGSKVN
jgi:glycosyltransferase involved in cell wall biosynthesis